MFASLTELTTTTIYSDCARTRIDADQADRSLRLGAGTLMQIKAADRSKIYIAQDLEHRVRGGGEANAECSGVSASARRPLRGFLRGVARLRCHRRSNQRARPALRQAVELH